MTYSPDNGNPPLPLSPSYTDDICSHRSPPRNNIFRPPLNILLQRGLAYKKLVFRSRVREHFTSGLVARYTCLTRQIRAVRWWPRNYRRGIWSTPASQGRSHEPLRESAWVGREVDDESLCCTFHEKYSFSSIHLLYLNYENWQRKRLRQHPLRLRPTRQINPLIACKRHFWTWCSPFGRKRGTYIHHARDRNANARWDSGFQKRHKVACVDWSGLSF